MLKIVESKRLETTIAQAINLDGLSANDFKDCTAQLLPAASGQGIIFETRRGSVPANIDYMDWEERRHTTSLRAGISYVRTTEHLLSAIHGAGIDNVIVSLNRCGIPFRDFSAEWFSEKLEQAGKIELGQHRKMAKITESFVFEDPQEGRRLEFRPGDGESLSIRVKVDFQQPIGQSQADYDTSKDDYRKEIAWARSFVASPLDGNGDKWGRIRQIYPILPEDPTESPLITYDCHDFLTPLRKQNEPARHKMLDFLGDLSLLGYPLIGEIEAIRPGHRFTAESVAKMRKWL